MKLSRQFWLVLLGSILILALCGWWFYGNYTRVSAVVHDAERAKTAEFIETRAAPYLKSGAFVNTDEQARTEAYAAFYKDAQSPDLFRLKIWSKDYTILWSDFVDLIGQQFKDNVAVADAFSGNVVLSIGQPKLEHVSERQLVQLLEVYTPLRDASGNVILVVETYTSGKPIPDDAANTLWSYAAGAILGAIALIFLLNTLVRRFIP